MTTTDPNAPDAALLWAQSTRDTHHSEHRTRERAEAHRAGQAHERRADAGLLAALECYARDFCETSFGGECCGKLSAIDCGGCAAYAAINAAKGTDHAE